MSLAASDTEDWSGSVDDPPLPSRDQSNNRAGLNAELFRVLFKATEELGLE